MQIVANLYLSKTFVHVCNKKKSNSGIAIALVFQAVFKRKKKRRRLSRFSFLLVFQMTH